MVDGSQLSTAIVQIVDPKSHGLGTGFLCHPNGYLLTAYHVIEPALLHGQNRFTVIWENGESGIAHVVADYCIPENDLALLQLDEPYPSNITWLRLAGEPTFYPGQIIQTRGFPEGPFAPAAISVRAAIDSPDHTRYFLNGKRSPPVLSVSGATQSIRPGFSGAPVLDERNGKIIALLHGSYSNTQALIASLLPILCKCRLLSQINDPTNAIVTAIAAHSYAALKVRSDVLPISLRA